MKARNSFSSKFFRLIGALLGFIGALCLVLYLGFGLKFENPKNGGKNTSDPEASARHTFYRHIGATSSKVSKAQEIPASFIDKYTLELKVVTRQEDAERVVNDLAKQGVKAYYTPFQSHGKVFYRIRQGLYGSLETAEAQAKQLKLARGLPVTVIKLQ